MTSVVEDGLGLTWQVHADPYGLGLDSLAGLALRDNPRRAQLVVSRVLGKHLPVAPGEARDAGRRLAELVGPVDGLVIGFCETATALGHLVAEALGAPYVHTTRRPEPGVPVVLGFQEEHSHAVEHILQIDVHSRTRAVLAVPTRPVVLVDDELTSGRTALNTIAALHAVHPHERYVVATLLDLRPQAQRAAFGTRAAELGVQVDVVALLDGELTVPADALGRAARLRVELARVPAAPTPAGRGRVEVVSGGWPVTVPLGGRTGTVPGEQDAALEQLAGRVSARLSGGPVLVLGTEELMWLPLRLADALPGPVAYHSTTRSPVLAADLPGYAVRRVLLFPAPDRPGRVSRLHGLLDAPYADVVVVVDTPVAPARPLAEALRPWAAEAVHLVVL